MPRLYLGIDGGQSSTTAFIANKDGRVIGYGRGGPCNHVSGPEGRAKFMSAVGACLAEACHQAGVDAKTVAFAAAALGFSGGPEDKEAYTRELIRSERYKITHDAEIALSGATAGMPGIIIIAGTGSMAFGRNGEGETARAGGWGYVFGDEGGAFDLTRRALRALLRHEEGWGSPTILRELLLEATGAMNANDLLHRFYTPEFARMKIASFARLVSRAAESGDEIACRILDEGAEKLAEFVRGVYQHLFTAGESVPVAYIGGVFRSGLLLRRFKELLRASIACEADAPLFGPAAGALLEALRLDGNQSKLSNVPELEK
jgi:N-acetylglucosamine kinase-like BadF-type ATPase